MSVFIQSTTSSSVLITQSLSVSSMTTLSTSLEASVSASGQAFSFITRSVESSITLKTSTFGFFSSTTFLESEFSLIEMALAQEWSATYTGKITYLIKEHVFLDAQNTKLCYSITLELSNCFHYLL